MFVSRCLNVEHADLIHDVAYDFYGKRMVTCSGDQMVKVWDLLENGEWKCFARWRSHLGPVWRVTWAHPEFGQIIATCSFDRTVEIWEEIVGQAKSAGDRFGQAKDEGTSINTQLNSSVFTNETAAPTSHKTTGTFVTNTSWVRRTRFVDPRTSVTDIQFAPRHMGVQIACIDVGGIMRIYEAQDVMDLSQWTLQFDINTKTIGSCLSWSQSRSDMPLIAVGSLANESSMADSGASSKHGNLTLYEYSEISRQWSAVCTIKSIVKSVYDVAFSPHMGQSFQQLAVATADQVIILRIKLNPASSSERYQVNQLAAFDDHHGRVWRVAWNITGSLLASSGDDGSVRLWQSNYLNLWQSVSVINSDATAQDQAAKSFMPGLPIPPPTFA